jgi:hypothetical protein
VADLTRRQFLAGAGALAAVLALGKSSDAVAAMGGGGGMGGGGVAGGAWAAAGVAWAAA